MKKKLTGFALLSSLFLLTACNATNTDISGSGDSTSKSEQVSGDSSETEEVSYDELYASVLDLYRPIALNSIQVTTLGKGSSTYSKNRLIIIIKII